MSAEARFRDAMANDGIAIEHMPISDGQLHRFDVGGDRAGSNNGWYVLFGGPVHTGVFGCWKRGVSGKWCEGYSQLSEADRREADARTSEARIKHLCLA